MSIVLSLLVPIGCGGETAPPAIGGVEGVWLGALTGPDGACLWAPGETALREYSGAVEQQISLAGDAVLVQDGYTGRVLEGTLTASDEFIARWEDPASNTVETWSMVLNYRGIREGHAEAELRYCYSRPAYGNCCSWHGAVIRTE